MDINSLSVSELKYNIRKHRRNLIDAKILTEPLVSKEVIIKNGISSEVIHIRHKKTILQCQKSHNSKASKQLAIEEAKRAANRHSDKLGLISCTSKAKRKIINELKNGRRAAAIKKYWIELLINK